MHLKTTLTIAGSDPTGGAGLQMDLKVFKTFGVHGLSVVAALTAQNTQGVDSIFPVEKSPLEKQLRILLSDIKPDALKIGMLFSGWSVQVIADMLKEYALGNLVVDPVTVSSSGKGLADEGTLDLIRANLFPLSRMITPNIYEASVLTGIMIEDRNGMEEAARALKKMGPEVVLITGGHLDTIAVDLFYDGDFHAVEGEKIKGEYHGTGCAYSAAVAACLALGYSPLESVRRAKDFIHDAIKKAYYPGKGMGLLHV